jgi:hypothetical protein
MYPMLCSGGYGVPMRGGKYEIIYITALTDVAASTARLTLLDDSNITTRYGTTVGTKTKAHEQVVDIKRLAVCETTLKWEPTEPMKVRYGLSVLNATNLIAGSINVYVR